MKTNPDNIIGAKIGNVTIMSTDPFTTYREVKIGKVTYLVTSVFLGKFTLKSALEDLAVKRALKQINTLPQSHSEK